MSDTVLIINAILVFLGTIFTGIMAYLMARLNQKQTAAAVKVDEVKQELVQVNQATAEKLAEVAVRVEVIQNVKVETATLLDALSEKIEEVHKATNSLTDRLVESSSAAARSEGHEAGRLLARDEAKQEHTP